MRAEKRVSFRVKSPFLSDFNQNWYLSTHFLKIPQYKFNENPFNGSRVVHTDRRAGGPTWRSELADFYNPSL
jgi:hypothetical protein